MTLHEAVKTGMRIKRPKSITWCPSEGYMYYLNKDDLLADDWEIETETLTISEKQLSDAITHCMKTKTAKQDASLLFAYLRRLR